MKKWMLGLGMFLWAATALAQPVISNVFVSAATSSTVTINWTTNTPASSQIRYGFDISLPFSGTLNSTLVTNHSQTLTFLNPATLYYFAVVSTNGSGSTQSTTTNFSLCGAPGTVPIQGTANNYYMYGSYTLTWVPPAGSAASPTICGQPVTTTVTGRLDGGASFSATVADSYMTVPGPGTWHVSVTDPGNIAPIAFNYPIAAVNTNVSTPLQNAANASGLTFCLSNPGVSAVFPSNCGGGGGSATVIEINGTPISPASPANFVDTATTTLAFVGGQIQITATGGGGGTCGPLAGDATSTDCGTNNLTSPSAAPAFLQAFGDNNLNTPGTSTTQVVTVGDANANNIPTASPHAADLIGVGNDNLDTLAGQISDAVCMGDQNCRNMGWNSDVVAIGQANFLHNVGPDSSDSLTEAVAIGLANVQYIQSGGSVVGIGQSSVGGIVPAGSTDVFEVVGIGDSAGFNIGNTVNDLVLLGDQPAATIPSNSNDIVAIGDAADKQCLTFTGCGAVPNPVAVHDVIAIGHDPATFNQANDIVAIGDFALGSSTSGAGLGFYNQGIENIAIGHRTLTVNTTGTQNVALGGFAGADGFVNTSTIGNSNKTGSNNTWVGYDSGPNTTSQLSNTAALGYQAHNTASNQIVLGNSSMTQAILFGTGDGCLSSLSGVITGSGSACGSGGGGGSNVTVNGGSTLTTANFNGTTPAAGASFINVTWQVSSPSVSAEVPFGSASGFGVLECGSGTTCTGGVISVSGGGGGDTITSPNSTLAVGGTSTNTTLDLVGAAGKIMAGSTPALTFAPALGIDGTSAGSIQLANASAAFHTIYGSAATANNTILGFATAPTNGDLVSCTTATTTCTLTDAGVLAANVVTATSNFAANRLILGGGTNKTLTSAAGLATDGTSHLLLGVAGSSVGQAIFSNVTSGSITVAPPTGALGAVTNTLQAATDTFVYRATTDTLTNKTISGSSNTLSAIALSSLANQVADTVVMNASGSTAPPTAVAMPTSGTNGCAGTGNALTYNTSTHALGCNTISGSGTVNTGTATQMAYYATTGTAVSGDTLATDSGTIFSYTGTGGISATNGPITAGNPGGGVGSQFFLTQEGTVPSGLSAAGQDNCYADSTAHGILCNFNATSTHALTQTIASGTSALGTSSISSATCATVVTTTATGTLSTDAINWTPNGSIKAVTGYVPSVSGGLTIAAYPTANSVNFDVCNWSSGSITPGAVTINWRVVR